MNSNDQTKPRRIFTGAPPHAQSSERIRQTFAGQGIRSARMTGRNASDDEIYREVGYRDANEYWSDALSEPMKVSSFVHLLEGYFLNPALDGCDLYRLEIDGALRSAKDTGEQWFIEVPDKELMLHPRKAAEWLLSRPKRRHLLPPGLVDFLEPGLLQATSTRHPGGRPTAADWEAIAERIEDECKKHGFPNKENLLEWQSKSDVIKFIRDEVLNASGEEISEPTFKRQVGNILMRLQSKDQN